MRVVDHMRNWATLIGLFCVTINSRRKTNDLSVGRLTGARFVLHIGNEHIGHVGTKRRQLRVKRLLPI